MYSTVFEFLWIVFWISAYIAIAFYSIKYRNTNYVFMPFLAGSLNLACEIVSLVVKLEIGSGWIAHFLCIVFDALIFMHNVCVIKKTTKHPYLYILFTIAAIILLYCIFNLPFANSMLLSIFLIDLEMSVVFLTRIRHLSPHGRSLIGCLRFFGDLFAWLAYLNDSVLVLIMGTIITILNLYYICFSLELDSEKSKTTKKRKKTISHY